MRLCWVQTISSYVCNVRFIPCTGRTFFCFEHTVIHYYRTVRVRAIGLGFETQFS